MEWSNYNLMFIHIKGSKNIVADAVSGLKALDIYKDPLDYPKTSKAMTCIAEMVTTNIQSLSVDKLCAKEKEGH